MADGGCTEDLSGITPQQQQQQQQHTSGQAPQGLAVFQYSPGTPAPPNWPCATPIKSQCPPYYNQFWQSPANAPNTHTSSMNNGNSYFANNGQNTIDSDVSKILTGNWVN
ncbi:hypothetical protein DPMN_083010 [Dreissena polymorpha]|uniref:Uncharacterized protein n=1 Tax=Dreissena polymorpha TaxID=45954 RepID=A0A9D3YBM7_DREPO|nr:hypothetical protein DPMN_083010 [Dreissena polymorpha]